MSHPLKIIEILGLPKPEGIIHVGAHFGQEAPAYQAIGTQCCVYIEPIPTAFEKLKCNVEKIPNHFPIQALCSDLDGQKVTFNVSAGDGQSSSVFPLGNIKRLYPRMRYIDELKLETRSLDRIITSEFPSHNFDLLVMDTQGSELNILKGSNGLLTTQLKYIYSEVSTEPLYQGSCNFEEITAFLKLYGFRLKNAVFGPKNWGDAFYAKNFSSQFPTLQDNLALHKPALQSSLSRWSKPDDAQGAVNGTKTGKYGFCTKREANPWWQVDLLSIYKLTEVRIYNRIDQYRERVRTLKILVSSDAIRWEQIYDHDGREPFGGIDTSPLVVRIDLKAAKYVRLQLNEINCLHLDEVEVYGSFAV